MTKETLKIQGIKSILVAPIFLEKEYYGFVGLDVCGAGREWAESEKNLMWTAAWILSRSILLRRTARVLRRGKIVGLANHTMLVTRDGYRVPIADSAAPITDESGGIHGMVMVFRDVTGKGNGSEGLFI
ncbi:hypothetical protein SDD30_02235 [Moorella naiadis]|uniref:hypothetical protein n=1 Tax=Moorella naiadis (nom. illeg.) TaxID=3093670 RepID=UPI003D9C86E5